MIRIEITDPHTLPPGELIKLGTYLFAVAGQGVGHMPDVEPADVEALAKVRDALAVKVVPPEPASRPSLPPYMVVDDADEEVEDVKAIFNAPDNMATQPLTVGDLKAGEVVHVTMTATNTGAALDADGYPYDGRIHSREATKIKDGTWKVRRGVDPALVKQVRAEYDNAMAAPAVPPSRPATQAPPPPPMMATPAVPPAPPADPVTGTPLTFGGILQLVTQAIETNPANQAKVLAICVELGVTGLPGLAHRPDLLPHFHSRFLHAINGGAA